MEIPGPFERLESIQAERQREKERLLQLVDIIGAVPLLQRVKDNYWKEGGITIKQSETGSVRVNLSAPYVEKRKITRSKQIRKWFGSKRWIREDYIEDVHRKTETGVSITKDSMTGKILIRPFDDAAYIGFPKPEYFQNPEQYQQAVTRIKVDQELVMPYEEVGTIGKAYCEAFIIAALDTRLQKERLPVQIQADLTAKAPRIMKRQGFFSRSLGFFAR